MDKRLNLGAPRVDRWGGVRTLRAVRAASVSLSVIALIFLELYGILQNTKSDKDLVVDKVQKCSIDNLHKDLSFLDSAKPITADEFIQRRNRLAQALAASDIDAFVLEPGYTFQYALIRTKFHQAHEGNVLNVLQVLWQHFTDRLGTLGARRATISHGYHARKVQHHRRDQRKDSFSLSSF